MLRPLSLLLVLLALTGAAEAQSDQVWTTYVNERFGFSLRYPAELFGLERASEAGDVPRNAELRSFSEAVVKEVPKLRDYKYFTAENRVGIVDPKQAKVQLVIEARR